MNDSRILEKTEAGSQALSAGHQALDFASRTALIMVDGKKTASTIAEMLSKSKIGGDPTATLKVLLDAGLVKAVSTPASMPAPPSSSAPAPVNSPPTGNPPLSESVRAGVKIIERYMGPSGDHLSLMLEKAKNEEDFRLSVEKIAQTLKNGVNAKAAEEFQKATQRS